MNPNSLTPWDPDVPRLRRLSISDGNLHSSSHSMTSTLFVPDVSPTNQASRSMNHSPSSSTGLNGSTHNPWNKKYILTLDGGGVRGLSSLLIIQHLMVLCNSFEQSQDELVKSSFHPLPFQQGQGSITNSRKSRSAQFLPVHYFDYIGMRCSYYIYQQWPSDIFTAGTSSGGLSAIMLSRLRMNSDDCIQEYENLGENIFGQPRKLSMRGPIPWNREKYDHRKLEQSIKDVVKRRDWKEDQIADSMYPSNKDRCRTIVLAVRENNSANAPYLFRTYEHVKSELNYSEELNPGPPLHIPIWQVARATTAAPTYFKPFQLLHERFVDGGYGHNNPTSRTFAEVEQVHGKGTVALTLSIGTGRPTKVQPIARQNSGLISHYRQMIKYTAATTTDSEHTHEYVKALTADRCTYERFNVDGGLGDIDLGEWRVHGNENMTLKRIREQTHVYLNQSEVRRRMEKVAKMLVRNRQERSRTEKWDVVATGHRFHCPRCCNEETIFTREEDFKTHLCEAHEFSSASGESFEELRLNKAIRDGRILHAD
ncbi:hypothetical protein BOTNAR_0616g00060 [Botryotinia narcissicola]|uniref:PNPLA domain-containing protein n=1 Tax=Botryotinia narcissicola TaxID=278944 RepID=A0A4Z1HCN2_9HELO|nr:hypothetical protein BOTNAR_0616g00060 [Botryotinia narcissicola]